MRNKKLTFSSVLPIMFLLALFLYAPASAADRVTCTGKDLQEGKCKPLAGEDFTISLTDLNLAPGKYAIKYKDVSQSDFFFRCATVSNDRKFIEEKFPGSGIGLVGLELWRLKDEVKACTLDLASILRKVDYVPRLGTEISKNKFKIDFQPPNWQATVTMESTKRTIGEPAKIIVQELPADGNYTARLKTPEAGYDTGIRTSGKQFILNDTNNHYVPGTKIQVWRWSGDNLKDGQNRANTAAFLGEAVIGDNNPCVTYLDPTSCPFADTIGTGKPTASSERPQYTEKNVIDFCDPERQTIRTGLGCVPTDASGLVDWILRFAIGIGGGVALLLMVFSGIQVMTSQGDPEKLNEGKERFTSALIGLVFIVMSVFLLRVIGVDILGVPGL